MIFFLQYTLKSFNNQFTSSIKTNEDKILQLAKFSYDIYFNSPPDTIIIENGDPCTPEVLKVCDIRDQTSCNGCRSLLARCLHIEYESKYINYEGVELIIPPNANSNEGYCFTQSNPSQLCNPYHGDLVLVQEYPNTPDVMLICECKNPGYIGKTTLLGACDEVFVCDGKITNLNVPFEEVTCLCKKEFYPEKINDTPVCIERQVKNYTYTEADFISAGIEVAPIKCFTSSIRNNINATHLKDPCKYCLLTGVYIPNGKMHEHVQENGETWYQCKVLNAEQNGLPIRRDADYRILAGNEGPDAIININYNNIIVYGYIESPKFETMSIGVNMELNKAILTRMNMYYSSFDILSLKTTTHNYVYPGHFGKDSKQKKIAAMYCDHQSIPGWIDDVEYDCLFSVDVPDNRSPYKAPVIVAAPDFSISVNYPCRTPQHSVMVAYKWWKHYEGLNPIFNMSSDKTVNGLTKLEVSIPLRRDRDVRFLFFSANRKNRSMHGFTSNSYEYFDWYRAGLIPK